MRGKIAFSIKNRHIAFNIDLERNLTILTGDSGTGKTKLINMVRMYSTEGKASGVTLTCSKPCIVLEGNNWESILLNTHDSIVFVEESTRFLATHAFARTIQNTDNYYVFVTREPLPQIPYSIDSIKKIVKHDRRPKIDRVYKDITVKDISGFPYEMIIVEDSKAGFRFFSVVSERRGVLCCSSNGKSNIVSELRKCKENKILVIADAAALGSEIRELMRFKSISDKEIDFFFPESFEWLILKSAIFEGDTELKKILLSPIDHIECSEYFSWERFFVDLLVLKTKNRPQLRYPKEKNKLPSGYLTEVNEDYIINAMKSS